MRAARWLTLASLILAFVPQAHADQIPLGLPWKEVFVQEYWHNGKPHFAIANIGKADVAISTSAPDGPWNVKAASVVQVPVKPGKPNELLTISTAAGRLGLLVGPTEPAEKAKKPYVVHYGLNGSGGRFSGYYMQQEWIFPSEGTVEIDYVIPSKKGKVTFWKKAQHNYPLTQIFPTEVKCDSLTVTADEKSFVLDAAKPLREEANHVIHLKFKAPKVDSPTMLLMDGWVQLADGGGHVVARGVIVGPVKVD